MNDYGYDLKPLKNSLGDCTDLLKHYLNKGKLGLILGSGASALGLPTWNDLVKNCIADLPAGKVDIDPGVAFDPKAYSSRFKACTDDSEYLESSGEIYTRVSILISIGRRKKYSYP